MAEGNGGAATADVALVLDSFLKDMSDLDSLQSETVGTVSRAVEPSEKRQRVAHVQPEMSAPLRTDHTKKSLPSWQRRKQELNTLRQQTEALETRAAFLRLKHPEELVKWKTMAIKEQRRRQAAECENVAMKDQLRDCTRVANALQSTIAASALLANGLTAVRAIDAALTIPRQLDSSSSNIFQYLETRLDTRSQEIQAILDKLEHASAIVDSVDVEMYRGDGSKGEMMEYQCAQTLPFDELVASNTLWNSVRGGIMPQEQVCEIVKRSEDTVAARSRFVRQLARGEVLTADIHCVMRRVAVSAGCVVLAESATEWAAHHKQRRLWDHASRESICFVCRRCSLGHSDVGCHINITLRSESTDHQMLKNSPVTSASAHAVVMASCREMIESHRQILENRMWDSARGEPSNSSCSSSKGVQLTVVS